MGSGHGGITVSLHPSSALTLAYSYVRNRTAAMAATSAARAASAATAAAASRRNEVASASGSATSSLGQQHALRLHAAALDGPSNFNVGAATLPHSPTSSPSAAAAAAVRVPSSSSGSGGMEELLAGGGIDVGYPDAVIYAEVVVTGRAYMRNVTRIEKSWLAEIRPDVFLPA